ncbi:MAG: ribonuclease Z [Halobacteriaceae archaeon]
MTLRVTFLGTSGAVPTVERNPSALFVNREGDQLLFDVAEGTQRQMMRYGTGFAVDAVFLTHAHGDHVLGLPGLVQTWNFNGRDAPVTVYAPQAAVEEVRDLAHALGATPNYPLEVVGVSPGETAFEREDYRVETVPVDHRVAAVGYALVEDDRKGRFDRDRAEALGVPVGPKFSELHAGNPVELADGTVVDPDQVVGPPRPGRKVVYTGDTRPCHSVVRAAADADLLVHDGTFTEDAAERARQTAHSTVREAARVAREADAKRLALTHVSSRYAGDPSPLERELRDAFAGEAVVASDGQELEVPYPDDG